MSAQRIFSLQCGPDPAAGALCNMFSVFFLKIGPADPARNETRRGHGRDAAFDLRGMLVFRVPAPHGAQTTQDHSFRQARTHCVCVTTVEDAKY